MSGEIARLHRAKASWMPQAGEILQDIEVAALVHPNSDDPRHATRAEHLPGLEWMMDLQFRRKASSSRGSATRTREPRAILSISLLEFLEWLILYTPLSLPVGIGFASGCRR